MRAVLPTMVEGSTPAMVANGRQRARNSKLSFNSYVCGSTRSLHHDDLNGVDQVFITFLKAVRIF